MSSIASSENIFHDELDRLLGEHIRHGDGIAREHALHRVRKGVERRIQGDLRGKLRHVLAVEEGDAREERGRRDARLGLTDVVGEDGIGRDFAARARRRGDVRHGERFGSVVAREDLAVRPLLHGKKGDRLACVHRRAPADRHDEIGARALQKRDALPDAGDAGVGRDAVEYRSRLPVRIQGGEHIVERAVEGGTLARDDERMLAERGKKLRVFRHTIPAQDEPGRHIVPEVHHISSL